MMLVAGLGLTAPALHAFSSQATSASSPGVRRELAAYLASECATCHQATGGKGGIPPIADLPKGRLIRTMTEYRTGQRESTVMRSVAASLTEEEIVVLADYLSTRQH